MGFPAAPRMPFEPLVAAAGNCTLSQLSRRITAGTAVHQWNRQGGIPLYSADRAAAELGLHPMDIWGDDWLVNT